MIIVLDNILSNAECEAMIDIYHHNQEKAHTHLNPPIYPINFERIEYGKEFCNEISKKIQDTVHSFVNTELQWMEIVKWEKGTKQDFHKDTASGQTAFASILYLNQQYEGGSTEMMDGTRITPAIGRLLIFDGINIPHKVNEITRGTRYTIPAWYKRKPK